MELVLVSFIVVLLLLFCALFVFSLVIFAVHHKTGGVPFFAQLEGTVLRDSLEAMASGYLHILHLDFPSQEDAEFSGNWPFGENVFHVFAKQGQEEDQ